VPPSGRRRRHLPATVDVGCEQIATHAELVAAGLPISSVVYRIQPGGRWQRLLPGVVLMHRGQPTDRERLIGALAYAGPGAVITGMAALRLYGLRTAMPRAVHVLVPHGRRKHNHGFAVIERTRRPPTGGEVIHRRGLPLAPLARAVVDACRRLEGRNAVRDLVSDAVQNHGLTLATLRNEIHLAARQRTALPRAVLAEMGEGVRFAAEARARELIRERGLPEPVYNVEVLDDDGAVIAIPDGYYPDLACGYEIDSRRWHMSPDSYEATTRRRGRAARYGIILVSVTPARVFEDPDGFLADLAGVLATASRRAAPIMRYRTRAA